MTTKRPSDMPQRGLAMAKLEAVEDDMDLFWQEYGQSIDDVTELYKHFERECTSNPQAAATLVLATIMNLEEME